MKKVGITDIANKKDIVVLIAPKRDKANTHPEAVLDEVQEVANADTQAQEIQAQITVKILKPHPQQKPLTTTMNQTSSQRLITNLHTLRYHQNLILIIHLKNKILTKGVGMTIIKIKMYLFST